jgi:hypothetical protein
MTSEEDKKSNNLQSEQITDGDSKRDENFESFLRAFAINIVTKVICTLAK